MLIKGLYTVIAYEKQDDAVIATIKLNKDHDIFAGHFPGNPVMPGVCMIQIIKELTERAVGRALFLSLASNIKFMAIINPEKNDTLTIALYINEVENEVKIRNTTTFGETLALKLNATFKNNT